MVINKKDKPEASKERAVSTSSARTTATSKTSASATTKSSSSTGKKKKRKKKSEKRSAKRIILTILFVLIGLFLVACIAVAIYVISLSYELPDITAEDLIPDQNSFVYDQQGSQVATLNAGENREIVQLSEMPEFLIDMVIASEDERFYRHNGVDVRGILRAVMANFKASISAGSLTFSEGASTITMQLVRNVLNAYEKEMPRKIKEALLALEFEKNYEKDEILYYYMNEIYIGPEVYGMQAGAQYYFSKDVGDITMAEAALLVGLIRNPGYYSPIYNPERALNIRNTVLNLVAELYPEKYASSAQTAKSEELVIYQVEETTADYAYPWFVDYVIGEASDILEDKGYTGTYVYTGGLRIYTTMDVNVQSAIEGVYADDTNFPESSTGDIIESAMLIMDQHTGEIKGLVGGRRYTAKRGFNRATDLVRSPGSTIKPVVAYGPALDLGYSSGTVLDDSPIGGSWNPQNADYTFKGRVTMAQAVQESRNVCAVRMLQTIGAETGVYYGMRMGLPLDPVNDANLSLTLGGLTTGVAPVHMAGAFATFGNDGTYIEPYAITKITDAQGNILYAHTPKSDDVLDPAAAYIMTQLLINAVNGGTGSAAKVPNWTTAGKTGTNGLPREDPDYAGRSGNKDAWFVGYTPALTGAVWIGYDNKKDADGNLQIISSYGGGFPAQIFRKAMTKALEGYPNTSFTQPDGVGYTTVDSKVGGPTSELTPAGAYYSAMYVQSKGPADGTTGVEWVRGNTCSISGDLASTYCPTSGTAAGGFQDSGMYLMPQEGVTISTQSADYKISITGKVCTQHTQPTAGMRAYTICTHPDHDDEAVLANIAGSRQSGGCPEEYWETRYFVNSAVPKEYCDIDSHQVSGKTSGNTNNSNNDKKNDNKTNESTETGTLSTPTGLTATAGQGITLTWSDSNTGTIIYGIKRTDEDGNETKYTSRTKSYTDTSVEEGKTYTYRVYAYRESDGALSDWSSSRSVKYFKIQ